MKPPTRVQYPFVGRVGPIGLADKKSLGRPTRRLSQHPMGDRDSRHRMGERRLSLGRPTRSVARVWDVQQGGSRNIRWEIETHGIEWVSVACGRQA